MNKKLKFASLIVLTTLCFNITSYAKIYDITDKKTISTGIEITNIKRIDKDGWLNINVAEIDISKPYIDIKLLKDNEDIKKLKNIKSLADQYNTEVAINGDFFAWNSNDNSLGSAVGIEISDGNYLSSYAPDGSQYAVFGETNDNDIFINYINSEMTITAPDGTTEKIKAVNKYDDMSSIIMYTTTWGQMSPGSHGNLVEIFVENDVITSINFDKGPCEISENGYVLAFLQDHTRFLLDNFKEGDKIEINYVLSPDYDKLKLAMGGGTQLVTEGVRAKITHNVSGNNPRTALGISEDGKKLYFVTVDGRQSYSAGVSLTKLSDLLIEFGAYNAINLDGGGSTTMVAKDVEKGENTVVNIPSDNYLRPVVNGIGVVNTAKISKLKSFRVSSEQQTAFVHSSVKITAIGLDEYERNCEYNEEKIKYTISNDNGYIEGGIYYPEKEGRVKITASLGTASGSCYIDVLPMPKTLKLSTRNINMKKGEKTNLYLVGILDDGTSAELNILDCGVSSTNDIVELDGNTLKATNEGSTILTFSYGDASASISVNIGSENTVTLPEDEKYIDNQYKQSKIESTDTSFGFAIYGNTLNRNTLLEWAVSSRLISEFEKKNDLAFFVGDKTSGASDTMQIINTSQTDTSLTHKGNTFIVLGNKNGKMSANNFSNLHTQLKEDNSKNIFIIMSNPVDISSLEYKAFSGLIGDYKQKYNKDVYVICNDVYDSTYLDGAKYISVSGVEQFKEIPDALDTYYLQFYVKDGEVSYEKIRLYKQK